MSFFRFHSGSVRLYKVVFCLILCILPNNLPAQSSYANTPVKPDSIYIIADKMPQFPGGTAALFQHIAQQISYPPEAIKNNEQGKVVVRFVVDKTGKPLDATIIKSVSHSLDSEAIRVILALPTWTPAEKDGQAVSIYYTVPVSFHLNEEGPVCEIVHLMLTPKSPVLKVLDGKPQPKNFDAEGLKTGGINSISAVIPFSDKDRAKLIQQYGQEAANGVYEVATTDFSRSQQAKQYKIISIDDSCRIFVKADKSPKYPGGEFALLKFLAETIRYPEELKKDSVEGNVTIEFVVDKTGLLNYPMATSHTDPRLNNEALKVIKLLPRWIPGQQNGQNVNALGNLTLNFSLKPDTFHVEYTLAHDPVYTIVEKMPELLNGNVTQFLAKHIKYPVVAQETGIQGRVIVLFVINKEGKVENPRVVRSVDPQLDAEAIRVIKLMEWIPGEQQGHKVAVKYILSVTFRVHH